MAEGMQVTDYIAGGAGLLAAVALGVLLLGLALSFPVILTRALQVLFSREWIPLIYNLRSLRQRKLMTTMTALVLGTVVFVFTAAAMLALGIERTLTATGNARNVKVLHANAVTEWTSFMQPDHLQQVASLRGLAKDGNGHPLVSGEMVVLVWAPYRGAVDPDAGANLSVRGVHPIAFDVHPVRSLRGRRFQPGTQQVVIGKALFERFAGAELGGTLRLAEREWNVVGIADFGGTAHDSEIWGDVDVMRPIFGRSYSTATLVLDDKTDFAEFAARVKENTALREHSVKREVQYWRSISESYVGFVRLLGNVVAVIFSFGAILGALNTMYAQVSARTREIGTLRAIGFKPRAILTSLLGESLLLSLAGGALGVLGAAMLSRVHFNLTTAQTLSEITYGFHMNPRLVLGSLAFALSLGYAGGLLPALRASRIPIVEAVRTN